ncbi:MAG: NAD(P)H-binding protein [Solirubrobacteraceae bacterium]
MNILVTGVTGYVGSLMAQRLSRDGHAVTGFARHPDRVARPGAVAILQGDAVSGAGLAAALARVDVAYFLIHSMEAAANATDGPFASRERVAAERFAAAASAAGVRRIVYLGGLLPPGGPQSDHLASRAAVEEILRDAVPDTVVLRASIVIGARSRSFRFLVRLVERLPVLAVPGWRRNRTAPIDERDVVEFLSRAATSEHVGGATLDLGGPDVVSYGELIDRIADLMLLDRPAVRFDRLTVTPIAGRMAALIAGEQYELVGPLMESLNSDLLPDPARAPRALDVKLHSLDAAIERALREWERDEPLAAR